MTDDKRRMTVQISMAALVVAGLMGVLGWLQTGSLSARLLIIVSLVMFAVAYYVFETQFNER
jgi:hypothetical protein